MRNDTPHLHVDMNVTPFLDILLVLIITFMAAMTTRKSMDVQLPVECTDGFCADGANGIVLEVLADGSFRLNRTPVSAALLPATLHKVFDSRPEKVLQVAGHRGARYQAVLTAMDVAKSAGVRVISLPSGDALVPHD